MNEKEKSAHGAATPLGTLLKNQEQCNTEEADKSNVGKMILITTDDEVKELEYPTGFGSWKKLRDQIGNRCDLIERVQPKRLYTEIGAGIEFCGMSEEQFDIVFPRLEELGKRFKDADHNRV